MNSRSLIPTLSLMLVLPVLAQDSDMQPKLNCDGNRRSGNDRQQRFCEIREYRIGSVSRLSVDGRINGGVSIRGWDRAETFIRAKVDVWAPAEAEARAMAGQIHIQQSSNLRADAPDFGRDRGWAVSYEVFVPRTTDLVLKAHNGGIAISDVRGTVEFDAVNGGVSLKRLAGTVRGRTVNGGLSVELSGSRWDGTELDVAATNGGVSLSVPDNYSARLETRTVNGRISVDYPVSLQGARLDRELSVTLGSGGPLVRAVTTNGGVSVRRRS
ncbi:MAG TPA: DUF4097 family beta strand repeat-containing protein [Bryobacteraceae bacterium]|nr:DUF4097 family beta strand repeat-containing protein [Bryobacteraceae bacterium]